MIMYGLSTCPVCQRARKTLEGHGKTIEFRDVRADPLSEAELTELINEFGDRLVDRTSSDYRGLTDWLKASEADAQIAAKPKVMMRPVIQNGDAWHLGWTEKVEAALLAD